MENPAKTDDKITSMFLQSSYPICDILQVGFGSTSLKMTYSIPSVSSGFKVLGKISLPSMYLSVTKVPFIAKFLDIRTHFIYNTFSNKVDCRNIKYSHIIFLLRLRAIYLTSLYYFLYSFSIICELFNKSFKRIGGT